MSIAYVYYFTGKDADPRGKAVLEEIFWCDCIRDFFRGIVKSFPGRGYPFVGDMDVIYEATEWGNKPYAYFFTVLDDDFGPAIANLKNLIHIKQKNYMAFDNLDGNELGALYAACSCLMTIDEGRKMIPTVEGKE